ncbi:PRC-barrel domain-containing protein [Nitrosococcus wardiae]|uniref:PRC-barrel domain containing protein n=1 Tax=Nitrosococcus wardiae TaxID=1814290 RepID=A0A4P7BZ55_9GAMM|nr:PRC-barrel domain-containing protein [Nitrosococcus wardiae]QBQ55493.1 PRC-barrel domain containing protein [Nitrosococcus wardiae]
MNTVKWKTSFISAVLMALIAGPVWSVGTEGQGGQGMERERSTEQTGREGWASQRQEVGQGAAMSSELYNKTADEIIGMEVIGTQDEQIGEVDNLVQNRDTNNVEAVIATGQILGMGGKKVTVPLNELQLQEDKLKTALTQEQLEQRPEYKEEAVRYSEITQKDRPISDFAAFEQESEQQRSRQFEEPAERGEQSPQREEERESPQY